MQLDDSIPVADDEFVYRRIPGAYYNVALPLPVQPQAFRPRDNEAHGISVFRAGFVTIDEILLTIDLEKRNSTAIARLSVREIRDLGVELLPNEGLEIIPDPLEPPMLRGHALVPRINALDYADKMKKRTLLPILLRLAEIASRGIVRAPHPE